MVFPVPYDVISQMIGQSVELNIASVVIIFEALEL